MAGRKRRTAKKHLALIRKHRGEYERLLEEQGGGCYICGRPPANRRLHMDHDHKEMFIRGLLCFRCNVTLKTWITAAWLRAAADYLDRGNYLGLS